MTSKYRVRVRRARKKKNGITKRELSYSEISENLDLFHQLYKNIAKKVGFNLVDLDPNYPLGLKSELGDNYLFFVYEKDGKILAYFTAILNGDILEAHFLGFDENENRNHQIYLNILYDLVELGINCECREIAFSRTALEIKSSIGAEAEDMYCYVRHVKAINNKMVPHLISYLKPTEVWTPRRPFKRNGQLIDG